MNNTEIQLTVTGHPVRMTGASYVPRSIQALLTLTEWKNVHDEAPDAWLREDICKAFKYMVGLRLGNTPAVEMLPITAEMWLEIVGEGMNEKQDRERVRAGFKQLLRSVKWWPQPSELLKILPRRQAAQPRRDIVIEEQSDESHARGSDALKDILEQISR